jgi:hypothetical protein
LNADDENSRRALNGKRLRKLTSKSFIFRLMKTTRDCKSISNRRHGLRRKKRFYRRIIGQEVFPVVEPKRIPVTLAEQPIFKRQTRWRVARAALSVCPANK